MRFCGMMFLLGALCAVESNEEALFVRRIADFWEEGEYQIAKSQIEEFITQFPESSYSAPLCAALGDLFVREKNFFSAYNHYSKIQSLEFLNKVFLNRMQCLYEMQWYATLADECEAFLQNEPNLHATYFLAISLYHQCLNSTQEPEQLQKLAERARPHFETLSKTELSPETAQTYAHLCCILKDYQKAASIYLDLAKEDPENQEEMLFQAALIQSENQKEAALQTFSQIAQMEGKRGKEAAYNCLILNFELGKYEELSEEKILLSLPPEKVHMGRLFLGRSLLNMNRHEEAIHHLKIFFEENKDSETLRSAALTLLDASLQLNDLDSFDFALQKLTHSHPNDPELPKAYFSRAQMLKKLEHFALAKEQFNALLARFPLFGQRGEILFELSHLEYKEKAWEACREKCAQFLSEFPNHSLSSFAWRYLIASSTELASIQPLLRPQLISDLNAFLQTGCGADEKSEWELLLAKTHYELGHYNEARALLESNETPNALLLYSLLLRDANHDLEPFTTLAEKALQLGANLIEPAQIHTALFSAYIELSNLNKGAEHLYKAFAANGEIKTENLLWLAEYSFAEWDENPFNSLKAEKTAEILSRCKAALHEGTAPLEDQEEIVCKLAQLYTLLGRHDEAIHLLKETDFQSPKKALLLGEALVKGGNRGDAKTLFDQIVSSAATLRDPINASALLQLSRIKLKEENPNLVEIATQLKNLVLQKNLIGEPTYLEAALDYVSLQSKEDQEKKRTLLEKTKKDFFERSDLLSNDYHEARVKFPQKNKIFEGYMTLIEAEMALLRGETEESRFLLEQIISNPCAPSLLERAHMLLVKCK